MDCNNIPDKEILVPLIHQFLEKRICTLEENHNKEMKDLQNMDKELNNIHLLFKNILDLEKQALHEQLWLYSQTKTTKSKWNATSYYKPKSSNENRKLSSPKNYNQQKDISLNNSSKHEIPPSMLIHSKVNSNLESNVDKSNRYQQLFNNETDYTKHHNKHIRYFKPKREQKGYIISNENPTFNSYQYDNISKTPTSTKPQITYDNLINRTKFQPINKPFIPSINKKPKTTAHQQIKIPVHIDILKSIHEHDSLPLPIQPYYAFIPAERDIEYDNNDNIIDYNNMYRKTEPNPKHKYTFKRKTLTKEEEDKIKQENLIQYKQKVYKTLSKNFNNVVQFLTVQDKYTYSKLTKSNMISFFTIIKQQLQNQLIPLQKQIDNLHCLNTSKSLKKKIPPFSLSSSAFKAIDLLNQKAYYLKFQERRTPNDEILLIYKIYFILQNKNSAIIELIHNGKDDDLLWVKIRDHFIWERKDFLLGNFVQSEIREMDYSDKNIYNVRMFCKSYLNILNPVYYSKMCPTTGVFAFLIKEVLEYMGIFDVSTNNEWNVQRKYTNLKYEMSLTEDKIKKIDKFIGRL